MADPLSITASILTLVTSGFIIARSLYEISEGIGTASTEMRIYANEVDSLSKVLQNVRAEFQRSGSYLNSQEESLLSDLVEICSRILDPLSRLHSILRPLLEKLHGRTRKLRHLGLRLEWLFKSGAKLLFYRDALGKQKGALDTMLALLILKRTKDRSMENINILQISLYNSICATMPTLSNSKDSEFRHIQENSSELALPKLGTTKGDVTSSSLPSSHDDFYSEETNIKSPSGDFNEASALIVISQDASDTSLKEDVDDVEILLDRELELTSVNDTSDLYEDMRSAVRKLIKFATHVLQSSKEGNIYDEAKRQQDPIEGETKLVVRVRVPATENNFVSYVLPYDKVREWQTLQKLLVDIYPAPPPFIHRKRPWPPSVGESRHMNIKEGNYFFWDELGHVLLRQTWSQTLDILSMGHNESRVNPPFLSTNLTLQFGQPLSSESNQNKEIDL